jgi:DNA-binding ferritin-like protein
MKTVADQFAETLAAAGVKRVYGIVGDSLNGLTDAIRRQGVCDEHRDVATASLIEVWIDETERRTWFLFEASRRGDATGH